MPVANKIEEFLRNAPPGRLYAVVGYADVSGLAWLERHAAERPVTLLIGDTRRRWFQGQPQDRRAALDFLVRADVDVLSGYRPKAPRVHQRVFVIVSHADDQPLSGLAGSANLTDAGLFRNEETVVTVAREELPAVWQQTRVVCSRGLPAGERIAGYIRDAHAEQSQAPALAASRRIDPAGRASPRRPVPSVGGGRPPAQRTGGGRGSRRSARAQIGGALFWFGVAGVALVALLLMPRCLSSMTGSGDRVGPGTTPAAPPGLPSAMSPELQAAPQRPAAAPQPRADESNPQSIPPTTVPESERAIEKPQQGESAVEVTDEAVAATASAGVEGAAGGRVGELDDAAVAALSVVVAAARSVYEVEGGFGGASVAALEGMGLAIPATAELAEATGEENVALGFGTEPAVTPWVVSVIAPNPSDGDAGLLWAAAVRSPVACRAVVLDPDLGAWAGMTQSGNCSGQDARNSYVPQRGVGGQRAGYTWAPATTDNLTASPEEMDGVVGVGELDDAAVAALSVVVAAARSVYEVEGGFGGASVAALEGMGLAIPATAELAEATGEENVALGFGTEPAVTPWVVSVIAPNPSDGDAGLLWAAAVRSPVACRAVVLDPDLGAWAGMTQSGNCSGQDARNSYVPQRGVGGQRAGYTWAPATTDRTTGDEPPADEVS